MPRPSGLTPAQRSAFFRALQAASIELGHDTPEAREAYRKTVMREETGKAHLAQLSRTADFDACMRRFAADAGDIGMHIYTVAGDVWGWHLTDSEVAYLDGHMDIELFEGDDIEFLRDVPLSKCLYVYEDLDLLHELALAMDPALTEGLSTTFSSGRYYEFNPNGVDKGAGLRTLAELLDVDLADTIVCGDSANDIAMLEVAGVGVVVSNASADAVAVADYCAKSSCSDGVFAEVYREFIA